MQRFTFDGQEYPTGPGCYLMKDAAGRILYVGKAVAGSTAASAGW
jgi:excinuclease UvrABC nuclease subunit